MWKLTIIANKDQIQKTIRNTGVHVTNAVNMKSLCLTSKQVIWQTEILYDEYEKQIKQYKKPCPQLTKYYDSGSKIASLLLPIEKDRKLSFNHILNQS